MATLASFKRNVKEGTRLLCVQNTYRPELDGMERVVTRAGPTVYEWRRADNPDARQERSEWPKAKLVTDVSEHEVTFLLGDGKGVFADHTVTLRILDQGR